MSAVIEIQDLKFRYEASGPDVLSLSKLTVQQGERVFLLGPSGSGKSTFLEILSGVLLPTSATKLEVCGENLLVMNPSQRDFFRGSHLGYIFQSFNLIPYLSVRDNIQLPLFLNRARSIRLKKSLNEETQHLTHRLGISELLDRSVAQLSVGQQQRVAAARALMGRPSLILADEPTSALDFDAREKFIELLFECCAESSASVLFVSHDRTLEKLFHRSLNLLDLKNNGGVR